MLRIDAGLGVLERAAGRGALIGVRRFRIGHNAREFEVADTAHVAAARAQLSSSPQDAVPEKPPNTGVS